MTPGVGAIFDHRAIILTDLVKPTRLSYISNIKGLGLLVLHKKIFKFLPIWVYVKQVTPWAETYSTQRRYFENLGRGSLDKGIYQTSKSWTFKV